MPYIDGTMPSSHQVAALQIQHALFVLSVVFTPRCTNRLPDPRSSERADGSMDFHPFTRCTLIPLTLSLCSHPLGLPSLRRPSECDLTSSWVCPPSCAVPYRWRRSKAAPDFAFGKGKLDTRGVGPCEISPLPPSLPQSLLDFEPRTRHRFTSRFYRNLLKPFTDNTLPLLSIYPSI